MLQEKGNTLREPYSKRLDDGIFELRCKVGNNITRVLFFIYTHGAPKGDFLKDMREIKTTRKHCREIGEYRCRGYDTFGPFKLVGGLEKGRCVPVARV